MKIGELTILTLLSLGLCLSVFSQEISQANLLELAKNGQLQTLSEKKFSAREMTTLFDLLDTFDGFGDNVDTLRTPVTNFIVQKGQHDPEFKQLLWEEGKKAIYNTTRVNLILSIIDILNRVFPEDDFTPELEHLAYHSGSDTLAYIALVGLILTEAPVPVSKIDSILSSSTLDSISTQFHLSELLFYKEYHTLIFEEIRETPKGAQHIKPYLESETPVLRLKAAAAYSQYEPDVAASVFKATFLDSTGDAFLRFYALWRLAKLNRAQDIHFVQSQRHHQFDVDWDFKGSLSSTGLYAICLAELGDTSSVAWIMQELTKGRHSLATTEQLLDALWILRDEDYLTFLEANLGNYQNDSAYGLLWEDCLWRMYYLGETRSIRFIASLYDSLEILNDIDDSAFSLVNLETGDTIPLPNNLQRRINGCDRVLLKFWEKSEDYRETFIRCYRESQSDIVKFHLLRLFSNFNDPAFEAIIVAALSDKNPKIRYNAIFALTVMKNKAVYSTISEMSTSDREASVVKMAAEYLAAYENNFQNLKLRKFLRQSYF